MYFNPDMPPMPLYVLYIWYMIYWYTRYILREFNFWFYIANMIELEFGISSKLLRQPKIDIATLGKCLKI